MPTLKKRTLVLLAGLLFLVMLPSNMANAASVGTQDLPRVAADRTGSPATISVSVSSAEEGEAPPRDGDADDYSDAGLVAISFLVLLTVVGISGLIYWRRRSRRTRTIVRHDRDA